MSAERLRERVSEATRSYPDDGPAYQRGVRSRQWLDEVAPDAILLLADFGGALAAIVKKNAQQTNTANAATNALTMSLLERLDALCGDER